MREEEGQEGEREREGEGGGGKGEKREGGRELLHITRIYTVCMCAPKFNNNHVSFPI